MLIKVRVVPGFGIPAATRHLDISREPFLSLPLFGVILIYLNPSYLPIRYTAPCERFFLNVWLVFIPVIIPRKVRVFDLISLSSEILTYPMHLHFHLVMIP